MMHATSQPGTEHAATRRKLVSSWAAYGAATWATIFGLLSFYWAIDASLGRGASANIVARHFVTLANDRDPAFIAILWATSLLKLLGGLFALSLVRPWSERLPPQLRRWLAWAGGVGLALYGILNFVEHGLMQAGVIETPASLGERALHWHLLVWDPFWLLGGLLYLIAAHQFRRP